MKHLSKLFLIFGVLALAACDSSDSPAPSSPPPPPPPPAALAKLQVLHASPDAPVVNVLVNGNTVLSNVDYKDASQILTVNEGTYSIQVDGVLLQ